MHAALTRSGMYSRSPYTLIIAPVRIFLNVPVCLNIPKRDEYLQLEIDKRLQPPLSPGMIPVVAV